MEIEVLLQVLIVTGASFNKTRLPFCEAPKPLPLIATVAPIDPVVADTLVITGAGSAVELIDTLSKVAVASAAGSPPAVLLLTANPTYAYVALGSSVSRIMAPACVYVLPEVDTTLATIVPSPCKD